MCLRPRISSRWRLLLRGALLLAGALAALGSPARAQPDVAWERMGDLPHDSFDLPLSFGPDSGLWGAFHEVATIDGEQVFFKGLYLLPPPYDSSKVWEEVSPPPGGLSDGIYLIGRDTILIDGGNRTYRSVTGGTTWDQIPFISRLTQLFEIPSGLPYAGRLIAARGSAVASFSDDRGATWTEAPRRIHQDDPLTFADSADAKRIAVVTTGPHAGRLVAAGISGITSSDDGGTTWQPTPEFAYFQQSTNCIATLHGQAPNGGDRLVTVLNDSRVSGASFLVSLSDDGGDTWLRGQGLIPGAFPTCFEVVDLGDGRAVAVMMRGPLWWTEDAGETWARWAEWDELVSLDEAAAVGTEGRARWAIVAPDGRLIVGITSNSAQNAIYDKRFLGAGGVVGGR